MYTLNHISNEQALNSALAYAGLADSEFLCLANRYENGYFHIAVRTSYMRYEFYVDASDGEVAGIDAQPVSFEEALYFSACREEISPTAA